MSVRQHTPCDDGVCPYADMHSGYWNSCEYWCGLEESEDDPEIWEDDRDCSPSAPWNAPGMKVSDFI